MDIRHETNQLLNSSARVPTSLAFQELELFWKFFPKEYIMEVVLVETTKKMKKPLLIGEFTRWLGIVLLMSTVQGCHRRDFWSIAEIDAFDGAPYRFNCWMARDRFEEIMSNLTLTNIDYPAYKDGFH